MKVKTSVTLSKEILKEIDSVISKSGNRSVFIEEAVRAYLDGEKRKMRDIKDADILKRAADTLNKEAHDILSYQVKI